MKLGISGTLTKAFIASPLTPLILLSALMLGGIALVQLPREEEPQISVPMVDIQVRADGLKAQDAARLVTEPLETIIKAINGVEHVYSQTNDDQVLVTARFLVGTKSDEAILRPHRRLQAEAVERDARATVQQILDDKVKGSHRHELVGSID